MEKLNLKFLQSLATQYPSVAKACTEIINLQAILNLPKETEHFVSDVHGEYEQFLHILKTGSGAIRNKIEDVFGNTLCARDKKSLAALIYYPEQKVERMRLELSEEDFQDWYKVSLHRLIAVCKESSAKYTRSKLRKSLPADFSYILEELLSENNRVVEKEEYYNEIFDTIIRLNRAKEFIVAIAGVIQKLVGQVIKRRPEFNMDKRLLLDKIDYEEGTIMIEGKKYELLDKSFPTIDPNNPYELSEAEEALMNRLCMNFLNCDKLQEHIRFLFNKGGLYLCYNSNLLYHGCVPLDEKGNFRKVKIGSKQYSGKELYDVLEYYARKGYYEQDNREEHEYGKDIMWYIWSNENSPVYGKEKMATFERYFIADKEVQIERKDHYYRLIEREDVVNNILKEFGVDIEKGHIINGHMPVHVKEGESPVKCNGKVMIIDGGFSKAYRGTTGIAGYTLIYNSRGLRLVSHETFTSTEDVIEKEIDVHSDTVIREVSAQRERVIDTETGRQLKEQISDLEKLLHAYRTGQILEKE